MIDFTQKRYMAIADYPTSCDRIGSIRTESEHSFDMAQFPNIYRLTDWWEYRTPEEMPRYVQKTSSNDGYFIKDDYLKVEWQYNPEDLRAALPQQNKGISKWVAKCGQHYYNASVLIPKTKKDYDKTPEGNKPSAGG